MLAFVHVAWAGVIQLKGTYKGKNLFVQNPGTSGSFCTQEVYVNNVRTMTNINSSAYEIVLSHLKQGDAVTVKIVHKEGCKPHVLNPNVIQSQTEFKYTSMTITADKITFATVGDQLGGVYYIQHYTSNAWSTLHKIEAKGGKVTNAYSSIEHHHSGMNKYRIKYKTPSGMIYYSQTSVFTSEKKEVTFYPKRVDTKIYFSAEVKYEIFDQYRNSVLKGKGEEADLSDLKPGLYYITFDNKTEKILKKPN